MKQMLIKQAVSMLLMMLTPDIMKKAIDGLLDVAEEAIAKSETTVDDATILPLIELIRATFDIPDNDNAEKT